MKLVTWAAGALLAGLVTSVHCAGMCGPIACGIGTLARSEKERLIAATVYHGARLFSYSLIGAVCGMIGKQPLQYRCSLFRGVVTVDVTRV